MGATELHVTAEPIAEAITAATMAALAGEISALERNDRHARLWEAARIGGVAGDLDRLLVFGGFRR